MKTSELSGLALDWAVAKCEGFKVSRRGPGNKIGVYRIDGESWYETRKPYNPSTEWEQGGPIIQRENLEIVPLCPGTWRALAMSRDWYNGRTPLEAAMRCYVASKLGEDIDVPSELIGK
jgi:hypothetical protein